MKVSARGEFIDPKPGRWLAICTSIIDLGTQTSTWMGKASTRRKVRLTWELPEQKMDDGRPFIIGRKYTLSIGKKSSLKRDLESWRGRPFNDAELGGFELRNVLGKPCELVIMEKETKDGVAVSSIIPIKNGTKVPKPVNPLICFSLEPGEYDPKVYAQLSDRTRETIASSPEYRALVSPEPADHDADSHPFGTTPEGEDDEVPF